MPIKEMRSITTFVRVAELGSMRKAAQAQNITPQAASQGLAQLEKQLGVRLFHRTTRSMSLTEEGRQLLGSVRPALLNIQNALQTVQQTKEGIAGPLRIVGPRSTFRPIIASVLNAFCQVHPEVQANVQLDDGDGNWVEDRVDVGFRIGRSPQEGLIARPLLPLQLIICASPEYLKQHGVPENLEALSAHRCSAFRHPSSGRVVPWHINVAGTLMEQHVTPAFCTNDEELELDAALSGQVIAQVSSISAAPLVRAGRLVPILTQHTIEHGHLFIYYGSRNAQPMRARAFIDFTVKHLADYQAFVLSAEELEQFQAKRKK